MTTTVLNTKISEVENKMSSVIGLVKKTDNDVKIKEIVEKYFTTADFNKFTSDILGVRIKQNNKSKKLMLIKN